MPLRPRQRKKSRLRETTSNAQFSLCYRLNAGRPRGDRHFSFLTNNQESRNRGNGNCRDGPQSREGRGAKRGSAQHQQRKRRFCFSQSAIYNLQSAIFGGGIAQLVERQLCKLEVRGSNPLASKACKAGGERPSGGPLLDHQ